MRINNVLMLVVFAIANFGLLATTQLALAGDPATTDPEVIDPEHPPSFGEDFFRIEGDRVNALWLYPNGPGPFPTIISLHGFPGNEKNLDVAQALRRAGYVVFFFHYRGAWGSGGTFSFANAKQDVDAAVEYVKSFCNGDCKDTPIDPEKIALFGHSMGGWLALMTASERHDLSCAMAVDFWNVGKEAASIRTTLKETGAPDPAMRQEFASLAEEGAPLDTPGPDALLDELIAMSDDNDPVKRAKGIARVPLFLLSTNNNDSHATLLAALKANEAQVRAETWNTSHSFNDKRIALSKAAIDWYSNSCGF